MPALLDTHGASREGSDVPAACEYDNFLSCSMAAIVAGGG
jgi:hypothetical protein